MAHLTLRDYPGHWAVEDKPSGRMHMAIDLTGLDLDHLNLHLLLSDSEGTNSITKTHYFQLSCLVELNLRDINPTFQASVLDVFQADSLKILVLGIIDDGYMGKAEGIGMDL